MNDENIFKGLDNPCGANNCFLNVVIQSLWHLNSFRKTFLNIEKHQHHSPDICVVCSLQTIFANYKYSQDPSTTPQVLREGLSQLYKSSQKFQLNAFDDASEVFVAILENVHNALMEAENNEKKNTEECSENCLVHKSFGLSILEHRKCECGETTKPFSSLSFIYYTFSKELIGYHKQNPYLSLEKILKQIKNQDYRKCPRNECQRLNSPTECLLSSPDIFTLGIAWDSPNAHPDDEIFPILDLISENLNLNEILTNESNLKFKFKGMICYYGFHYVTIFKSKDEFIFCDDTLISRSLGTSFNIVKEKCVKGHLQPTILFFERLENNDNEEKFMIRENLIEEKEIIENTDTSQYLDTVTKSQFWKKPFFLDYMYWLPAKIAKTEINHKNNWNNFNDNNKSNNSNNTQIEKLFQLSWKRSDIKKLVIKTEENDNENQKDQPPYPQSNYLGLMNSNYPQTSKSSDKKALTQDEFFLRSNFFQ